MRRALLSFVLAAACLAAQGAPPSAGVDCGPQPYPFPALQNWQRGQVVVRSQVGADGRLVDSVVTQPTANAYLNAGALQAMRSCRAPGLAAGSEVRLLVIYDFAGQDEYLPRGVVTIVPASSQ